MSERDRERDRQRRQGPPKVKVTDRRRVRPDGESPPADQLTYQVDKALVDYGDKVPQAERDALSAANDAAKEALKGDDLDRIKATTDELMQVYQRVGQAMYAQAPGEEAQAAAAGGGAAAPPSGEAATGDGDVVEGEIVDEGGAS